MKYNLINDNGLQVEFLNLGGRLNRVVLPGESPVDILIGYPSEEEAASGDVYLGAICGRVANRIGGGQFSLNGKTYQLTQNDGTNQLHGGPGGFHSKQWQVEKIELKGYASAYKLSYTSPDGEEQYPGTLKIEIVYALNNDNELLLDIKANTDKTTVVNITSHPYFNLNGIGNKNIYNHELTINAKKFTPINKASVPTGELKEVQGTDMDFRTPIKVGDRINSQEPQIQLVGGLDHNWVVDKEPGKMDFALRIAEPETGRAVEVYTTQPGIQVYAGMHFDGSQQGIHNLPIHKCGGIALEAQNFPDAPNHRNFPSPELKPDHLYHQQIIYKFIY